MCDQTTCRVSRQLDMVVRRERVLCQDRDASRSGRPSSMVLCRGVWRIRVVTDSKEKNLNRRSSSGMSQPYDGTSRRYPNHTWLTVSTYTKIQVLKSRVHNWDADYIESMVDRCNSENGWTHVVKWNGQNGHLSIIVHVDEWIWWIGNNYISVDDWDVVQGLSHILHVNQVIRWFFIQPFRSEKL